MATQQELIVFAGKPIMSGLAMSAISSLWFGEPLTQNITQGVVVGTAVLASDLVSDHFYKSKSLVEKSLQTRATEVGVTGAGVLALEYVTNTANKSFAPVERVAAAVAAQMIGEWVSDSFLLAQTVSDNHSYYR